MYSTISLNFRHSVNRSPLCQRVFGLKPETKDQFLILGHAGQQLERTDQISTYSPSRFFQRLTTCDNFFTGTSTGCIPEILVSLFGYQTSKSPQLHSDFLLNSCILSLAVISTKKVPKNDATFTRRNFFDDATVKIKSSEVFFAVQYVSMNVECGILNPLSLLRRPCDSYV